MTITPSPSATLEKVVREIQQQPGNRTCCECHAKMVQYVDLQTWTFVCETCAGLLRNFNHRIKSITMAQFKPEEVEQLRQGGNEAADRVWMASWKPQVNRRPNNREKEQLADFLKQKYDQKCWYVHPDAPRTLQPSTPVRGSEAPMAAAGRTMSAPAVPASFSPLPAPAPSVSATGFAWEAFDAPPAVQASTAPGITIPAVSSNVSSTSAPAASMAWGGPSQSSNSTSFPVSFSNDNMPFMSAPPATQHPSASLSWSAPAAATTSTAAYGTTWPAPPPASFSFSQPPSQPQLPQPVHMSPMWPSQSMQPMQPTQPATQPNQPVQPMQSMQPMHPMLPNKPMQPTQPMQSMQPTQPIQYMQPMQPMQPTLPVMQPNQPVPIQSMPPLSMQQPMQPMQYMQPIQPMQPMQPMQPTQPMPAQPMQPTQPIQYMQPMQPMQPTLQMHSTQPQMLPLLQPTSTQQPPPPSEQSFKVEPSTINWNAGQTASNGPLDGSDKAANEWKDYKPPAQKTPTMHKVLQRTARLDELRTAVRQQERTLPDEATIASWSPTDRFKMLRRIEITAAGYSEALMKVLLELDGVEVDNPDDRRFRKFRVYEIQVAMQEADVFLARVQQILDRHNVKRASAI